MALYWSTVVSFDLLNYFLGIAGVNKRAASLLILLGPVPKLVVLVSVGGMWERGWAPLGMLLRG